MSRWACPRCEREFDGSHQAHTCIPAGPVAASFARYPAYLPIYAALLGHLSSLGPVHEDAVTVGVFLKSQTKFAEVRPMARALSLELVLPRPLASPRVLRSSPISAGRVVNTIRLTEASEVDDQLRAWLTESYRAASG